MRNSERQTYPECKTVEVWEDWFGTRLEDPYQWLKNPKDPQVLDFVRRENEFTDQWFDQEKLGEKIRELKENAPVPLPRGIEPWRDGYVASVLKEGDFELQILDGKLKKTGVLPKVEGREMLTQFQAFPSPADDRYMAVMEQYPGAPRPLAAVYDMETGEVILEKELVFSFAWSKADGCLYYSSTDSDARKQESHSVFYRFDPEKREEQVVYEDDSYAIFGQVYASSDGKYIMALVCQDYSLARYVAIEAASGKAAVLQDTPMEWSYVDSRPEGHYFVSMSENPYGRAIRVKHQGEIETVCEGTRERILESGFSAGGKLFLLAKEHVSARLMDLESKEIIPLPDQYGSLALCGHGREGVFLKFESFLQEPQLLFFDGSRMEAALQAGGEIPGNLRVIQGFAPSTEDQTKVPYYLVYREDCEKNGRNPALMYAYGGYNLGMPPSSREMVTEISVSRWVQEGGIYVHINNRGGNEYGPRWHEEGMKFNKRRCYEDFIGVAEHLIREGWTAPGKIGIAGCSNGGLLMSALVTMRPDLWGCVIDSVPHTDMIHFAEDDRGPMYITEYGNPRESKEMFEYLLSYSPYHNVSSRAYPPTYIQTGEMDNNVPPYHGKKLAARMQAMTTGGAPILLRVLPEGSHDRGSGEAYWKTIAEMQLFLEEFLRED